MNMNQNFKSSTERKKKRKNSKEENNNAHMMSGLSISAQELCSGCGFVPGDLVTRVTAGCGHSRTPGFPAAHPTTR